MSVETYWDQSYYPGMGGDPGPGPDPDPNMPVITFPVDGLTVPPVHDVRGTAQPGQTVALWSAIGDGELAEHASVVAESDGSFVFAGTQPTGRDGDVATFEARTDTGDSVDVSVTVRGPVLTSVLPESIAAEVPGAFILAGERFLTMPRTMQVRIVDPGGTARRIDPDGITATQVTFDATFPTDGEAIISLADIDGGPEMTDRVTVTVTPAAEEPEPEPDPEPDEDPEP